MQTPQVLADPGSNSVTSIALVVHVLKNNKPERLNGPLRKWELPPAKLTTHQSRMMEKTSAIDKKHSDVYKYKIKNMEEYNRTCTNNIKLIERHNPWLSLSDSLQNALYTTIALFTTSAHTLLQNTERILNQKLKGSQCLVFHIRPVNSPWHFHLLFSVWHCYIA